MTSYRDRDVLVIGGLGFIGVNLTRRLAGLGATIDVLTPARERHSEQIAALEASGVRVHEGDVRDSHVVTRLVADRQVVFNLSGQSGAVRSMEDPWTDLDVNLRGTLVLLEALREVNRQAKLVVAGSRLQYGRPRRLPVGEGDERQPLCLHAIHKQTVEEYIRLYARLFGLRAAVARVTNPYGPGQPSGRTAYGVINRMIHLALENQPLTIYGDGHQRRDYVFVDDVVDALLVLGKSEPSDGRVYNVGSGVGTRMIDVAELIVQTARSGRIQHAAWPPLAEQIETGDFIADITRIRQEVGWVPQVSLADGIAETCRSLGKTSKV